MISIYTDGAYNWDKGVGGWAAVIHYDKSKEVLKGREEKTTSNRMELMGAIQGLAHTPEGSQVSLYSDSQYLVHTMTRNWKRRANLDLWSRLDELVSNREVRWQWEPGHQGTTEQEEAHRLADEMAEIKVSPPPPERVRMVDVGEKPPTRREATAQGLVRMQPATLETIKQGKLPKGDVLATAQVAGIMAAKQTPQLIPLCHPLLVENVQVSFRLDEAGSAVEISATVRGEGKTGFEMEALTAVAVAALTIYDMAKGIDPAMKIEAIRLVRKSGGKSGLVELP